MPLTSYSGLVTALESWMNRTDLTDQIPDFIALFEARMNRQLRVPQMEETATASITEEEVPLPDDFLQLREVRLDDVPLTAMAPQLLHDRYRDVTGTPQAYAVLGQSLHVMPAPSSGTVTITYYQKIPALESGGTNWLLESYPDAYLYGVLALGAGAYLRDDERLAVWKAAWDEALSEIQSEGIKRAIGAAPLTAQGAVE